MSKRKITDIAINVFFILVIGLTVWFMYVFLTADCHDFRTNQFLRNSVAPARCSLHD